MRHFLLMLALGLAIMAAITWIATGANRGWTRTTVAVKVVDEVTGLEGFQNRKQFAPGIELLGLALLGAVGLAAASLVFTKKSVKQNTEQTKQL